MPYLSAGLIKCVSASAGGMRLSNASGPRQGRFGFDLLLCVCVCVCKSRCADLV